MKKYKKAVYIFFILLIIFLIIFLYTKNSKANNNKENEKGLAEIEYLEKEIVILMNKLNNIEMENYKLSIEEINEDTNNNINSKDKNSVNKEQEENKTQNEEEQSDNNLESHEEYTLKKEGVLINQKNIDWEYIKAEIEKLYAEIPTITLDIYNLTLEKENVLGFNQELDNLTISAKEENKEKTLENLSKLYDYVSKFAEKISNNENYKIIIRTKNNLLKAYSKLETKRWEEISNDINDGITLYMNGITNLGNNSSIKEDIANKIYIMLNELQNAVDLQDETIFLIKYKNILEEINKIKIKN